MISNKAHKGRVSSFSEIDMSSIEFVSIFYENGQTFNVVGELVSNKKLQAMYIQPFLFALINIKGGGYIILKKR